MEAPSFRRSTNIFFLVVISVLLSLGSTVSAIEIREIQRTQYKKLMPFYCHFFADDLLMVDDQQISPAVYRISNISSELFKPEDEMVAVFTLNGHVIFDPMNARKAEEMLLFDEKSLSLVPVEQAKETLKNDYYYGYSGFESDDEYYPKWVQPIVVNDSLYPYQWGTEPESKIYYDFYPDLDYLKKDQSLIPAYRKWLGSIYRDTINSNHGISYLLEMYCRIGDHQNGVYGFMSLADNQEWVYTTYKMNKPERLWRVRSDDMWGSWEFRIPYWHFLNPRFVIGPYEAHTKSGSGPECEMFSLGILDTKGNAITNNIVWLLDLDVSANGRYLIVTGVENKGDDTKWNGPYPTILYEVTYSGIITDNGVRLRDSAGTDGKIIKSMTKGQKCTVIEHSKTRQTIDGIKDCWYKIRLSNGTEGWVFGAWLDFW